MGDLYTSPVRPIPDAHQVPGESGSCWPGDLGKLLTHWGGVSFLFWSTEAPVPTAPPTVARTTQDNKHLGALGTSLLAPQALHVRVHQ